MSYFEAHYKLWKRINTTAVWKIGVYSFWIGATHNTKKDKIMNGGEQEYKSKRDWCGSAKAFLRPGQCRVTFSSFEYSAAFF